ncbi:MAG: ATP cone domain-containing protein [Bacteroidia bacterium]|nr:ATP cone domain-containing protein [Bacteroidia bacterium]
MKVRKYSGELTEFDIERLRNSLTKSGAADEDVDIVLQRIKPKIYDGMHSKEIYKLSFKELKKLAHSFAARYSLKRALRDLGPTGFYFEKWVAKFLIDYGYQTAHNLTLQGHAVSHEADVIAFRDNILYWIECKFRNTMETKIPVTIPMYFLSRIKDISNKEFDLFGHKQQFTNGWLITNSYFTSDSIAFGEYYHIKLLSWEYPNGNSIKNMVDKRALYPITCLTSINMKEKRFLLENEIILVKDLIDNKNIFEQIGLDNRKMNTVIKEIEGLLSRQ